MKRGLLQNDQPQFILDVAAEFYLWCHNSRLGAAHDQLDQRVDDRHHFECD
jgi:hypothetical protein